MFLLASMGGLALILGATTAAVLVWACRRKWVWLLIPVFALGWFGVLLGAHELYLYLRHSGASQAPEPVIVPYSVPEGGE